MQASTGGHASTAQNCDLVLTAASLHLAAHMRTSSGDTVADKAPSQSNAAATGARGAFGVAVSWRDEERTNWRKYGPRIPIKAAQAQCPDAAEISMREELPQLPTQEVRERVQKADLTPAQMQEIVPSSVSLKA